MLRRNTGAVCLVLLWSNWFCPAVSAQYQVVDEDAPRVSFRSPILDEEDAAETTGSPSLPFPLLSRPVEELRQQRATSPAGAVKSTINHFPQHTVTADAPEAPVSAVPLGSASAGRDKVTGCTAGTCFSCETGRQNSSSWWDEILYSEQPLLHEWRNRQTPLDGWSSSVGGQFRYRYMDERFRLRPQGTVRRDRYDLWRIVPFAEIDNGLITARVEAIDASIFNEDLPMLPIDENRADLLQYYLDVNLAEILGEPVHLRYGRQFLKYGSQLLVSPLPWANTYRNFEGFRMYYEGPDWSVDGFAVQPLNGAANNTFRPESFDTPDQSVWFSGVYFQYRRLPLGQFDAYWMWLVEEEPRLIRHDGRRHTLGGRYHGAQPVKNDCDENVVTWTWDVEGAWQFGRDDFQNGGEDLRVNAGFFSAISGLTWHQLPWQPTVKGLFWWGSGDDDPNDGKINTLTTLFPFGHYYWGLIDNFNGANLLDYSLQLSLKPMPKLTWATAWHWFDKASQNDAIYNIAGAPLGPTRSPRTVGQELDLLATYAVNPNLSLQMGYFWFWYGDAVEETSLARPDAQQFYFMATWDF